MEGPPGPADTETLADDRRWMEGPQTMAIQRRFDLIEAEVGERYLKVPETRLRSPKPPQWWVPSLGHCHATKKLNGEPDQTPVALDYDSAVMAVDA
jgi:hypothetical protein